MAAQTKSFKVPRAKKRKSIRPATVKRRRVARDVSIKASPAPKPGISKLDQIVSALRKPKGATISDLSGLTGWLPHSLRGAMAGALKKGRGLTITSEKIGSQRVYKIGAAK